MCFYWKNIDKLKKRKELTIEEIRSISESMDDLLLLQLSGGETFLRDDLADICKIFAENNNVRNISIPTNGFFTKKIESTVKEILDNCDSFLNITLSFNGIYDQYEKICGVKGSFAKMLKTTQRLKLLRKKYNKLSLNGNVVFSSFTQNNIEEISDFLKKLELNNISCSLVRGVPRKRGAKSIDIEKYKKIVDKLIEESANFNYSFPFSGLALKVKNDLMRKYAIKTYEEERRVVPCYAGNLNAVIDEVGNVFPCEPLNFKIGNLRKYDYNFKKIWSSSRAIEIRKKINEGKCYCTHECYMMTNVLFNPLTWFKK